MSKILRLYRYDEEKRAQVMDDPMANAAVMGGAGLGAGALAGRARTLGSSLTSLLSKLKK